MDSQSAARIPPGVHGVNVVHEEGPVGGTPEPGGLPAASAAYPSNSEQEHVAPAPSVGCATPAQTAAYPWCAECVTLGCNLAVCNEPCSCDCHEAADAARAMGLSLVREETDSGGDPRARLYP